MCTPALDDDLIKDSLQSKRVKVPRINLRNIHLDNKANCANEEILTETLQQFDAACFIRGSNRGQGLKTIQRTNDRSMLQSLPSPNFASEFESNNIIQERLKTTANSSQPPPVNSGTETISTK